MKNRIKIILLGLMIGPGFTAASFADEEHYISIRNTDNVWLPGNFCSLQFRLDNGGSGKGYNKLNITLRLKDKSGKTLNEGVMEVEPFGDSDAARSQNAFFESECVDDVSSIEVLNATEESNGRKVELPLSTFDPQYYKPLPIAITEKK